MTKMKSENPEPAEQAAPSRPLLTKFEVCRELLCQPTHVQNEILKGLDCHFKHDDVLQSRHNFLGDCFRALSDRGLLPALEAELTKRGLKFPKLAAPAAIEQARPLVEAVESLLATLRCENPVKVPLANPEGYREKNLLNNCGECRYCKVVSALAAYAAAEPAPTPSLCAKHWPSQIASRPLLTDRNCIVCDWVAEASALGAKEE